MDCDLEAILKLIYLLIIHVFYIKGVETIEFAHRFSPTVVKWLIWGK